MVKVVLVFALVKALACLLLIFNPFESKRYKLKYQCFKQASSVTFYSSMIIQIVLPILSYIYCGALWSSNQIADSWIRLWLLTYLLINALDSLYRLLIFCELKKERESY